MTTQQSSLFAIISIQFYLLYNKHIEYDKKHVGVLREKINLCPSYCVSKSRLKMNLTFLNCKANVRRSAQNSSIIFLTEQRSKTNKETTRKSPWISRGKQSPHLSYRRKRTLELVDWFVIFESFTIDCADVNRSKLHITARTYSSNRFIIECLQAASLRLLEHQTQAAN